MSKQALGTARHHTGGSSGKRGVDRRVEGKVEGFVEDEKEEEH